MKKQSVLSGISTRMAVLLTVLTLSLQLQAVTITAPTVSMPLVGVPVLQGNLECGYTGNTAQLVSYGDAKAAYKSGVSTTFTERSTAGAGNVITPQSLRGGFRSTSSGIGRNGYISTLSSKVSSLNGSGIAVIATNNFGSTMAKANKVIPNPDTGDTEIDGGDPENGAPLGDAIPLLLLLAAAYTLITHRKKQPTTIDR